MRDTLNDMQLYLIDEYVEDYQEGLLPRRDALIRIAAITGSMAFATALLAACGTPDTADMPGVSPSAGASSEASGSATAAPAGSSSGQQAAGSPDPAVSVPEDDPALDARMVTFEGDDVELLGYLATPTGDGPFPIILVCHENRGLTDHIKDVTRRVAKAGYAGLAVDLLSRQGGTSAIANPEEISGALGNAPEGKPVQDFQHGLRYMQSQSFADAAKVGMVGFCYGGGVTWRVATKTPELRAAVPFYGPAPNLAEVPDIQAAVLAIYAEQDQRINAGIADLEAAMQQHNKTFQKIIYPGVNHAFHNDTGPRYNREAATDAWAKTLDWFAQYVRA